MSEEKNDTLTKTLVAGVISVILAVIGYIYEGNQNRALETLKFQNQLIDQGFQMNGLDRVNYFKILYKSAIIDDCIINYDSLSFYTGQAIGQADRAASQAILKATEEYFKLSKGRVASSLSELANTIPIDKAIAALDSAIYYKADTINRRFELRFAGADGMVLTSDDKHYRLVDNKILAWDSDKKEWKRWLDPERHKD